MQSEDLFEMLHCADEKSWLRHTDFISEAEGLHGTIDKRLCKVNDVEFQFLRGKVTLKDQRLENFEQMFKSQNKNNFNNCLELKIAEYDGIWPSVVYMAYGFTILLGDRDFCMRIKHKKLSEHSILVEMRSIEHPDFPHRKDRVRGDVVFYSIGE